ncbi:MAG: GAF domain-containing protein [Gaiellaceae bacterium]
MASADVQPALERIEAETSVSRVLYVACGELVELLDATFASVSRVIGDLLVELSGFRRSGASHPLELYLVTDFPLTQEVIDGGDPHVVRRSDPGADPAEAALLERLGFDSLLMLPLRAHGQSWGLVEIYAAEDRHFETHQIEQARRIVDRVGDVVAVLERRV